MRYFKTNALRGGRLTQNSLPSGSRITMELPRTVSFAQAMLAPAWTNRSTFSLTRCAAIVPKVQIARQWLPAVPRTGHPASRGSASRGSARPRAATRTFLPSGVTSSNGMKRDLRWFFNYSQPPLVHMAARFSTAVVARLLRRVRGRFHSG